VKPSFLYNRRPPRLSLRRPFLLAACAVSAAAPVHVEAQTPPPVQSPAVPNAPGTTPQAPTAPGANASPPATPLSTTAKPTAPPAPITSSFVAKGGLSVNEVTGNMTAKDVVIQYGDTTLTADIAEGNLYREIVLSGNAKIVTRGAVAYADSIHVFPGRVYRLDNPRGVLQPEFLENRLSQPLFLNGGELFGTNTGYTIAEKFTATTCIEPEHHYEFRIGSAELFPHDRLVLRRVGVVFFGQKLIVLPYLVIPLNRTYRRPRTDYLPEVGQNAYEGFFSRFPYAFPEGRIAETYLRFDATQKLGEGYRFEQAYTAGKQQSYFNTSGYGYGGGYSGGFGAGQNGTFIPASGYTSGGFGPGLPRLGTGLGPQSGGLFAMQGYFGSGTARNFNASFRHQQPIGSGNSFGFDTELQKNSFLTFTDQTSRTNKFTFNHTDQAHGVNADLGINYNINNSAGFDTSQLSGNLRQSFDFDSTGTNRNNFTYSFNFSRYINSSLNSFSRTASLDSDFHFEHVARDYSFDFHANDSKPIGVQTAGSSFGTLERLPELQFSTDTINFKGGWLHQLPIHLDIGAGRYSEPSTDVQTERMLLGLTVQDTPLFTGRTEMTMGGGFEQRFYGDGAAQYILRNLTRLRQHLGGRSGFDLTYQYEQPEGGTPFQFDTFGRSHNIVAEGGYLDDRRFQATLRVGYDLLGTSSANPWQTLSTRLMWRPTPSVRLDSLATYDPNTSKFFSFTNSLRLRARNDFALDLLARYDPQAGKFTEINSQFNIPIGHSWRLAGLLRYDGNTGQFESTNFQVTHTWDCLEASLTYSDYPLGFRNDRELFFTLRITALPFFRSFARGPAGEAIGTGIGELY
jgi:hypothetical protein